MGDVPSPAALLVYVVSNLTVFPVINNDEIVGVPPKSTPVPAPFLKYIDVAGSFIVIVLASCFGISGQSSSHLIVSSEARRPTNPGTITFVAVIGYSVPASR